jgi:hypothetical protein
MNEYSVPFDFGAREDKFSVQCALPSPTTGCEEVGSDVPDGDREMGGDQLRSCCAEGLRVDDGWRG